MFRCEVCGSVTPPGTSVNRITVETREVDYPSREKVHWQPPRAGGSGKWVDDPGGHGTEIVREVRACASCAAHARDARPPPVRLAA
jgi:hypothetical protein